MTKKKPVKKPNKAAPAKKGKIRELSDDELDEVSGGASKLIVADATKFTEAQNFGLADATRPADATRGRGSSGSG